MRPSSVLPLLLAAAVSLAGEPPIDGTFGPFGVGSCHINNRTAQDNARWAPQLESIGVRHYRSAQTAWGAVEPEEGKWRWEILDEQMAYLRERRFAFGGLLLGNPRWNTLDKPGTLPVNNLEGWKRYVAAVVTHAKGTITSWEVWNEPPNFTGKEQTPADYAKLVVAAYDAAKAADPSCRIGLAAKSAHINYLEQTIRAGAQGHYDFVTLHPYELLDGVASDAGTEPLFMNIVPVLRKMLAAQDPAKAQVPVVFTELGVDAKKGLDTQAQALVKAYAMGLAQGVSCIHWFEARDGDSGPMGLLDGKGAPRPAFTAMAQLIRHLGQRPEALGWVRLSGRQLGFAFQGAKGPVLVAWSQGKARETVTLESAGEVVDPLTGESTMTDKFQLSSSPLFLLRPPAVWLDQARANKGRPLPWGMDSGSARSVSLRFVDGRSVSQGLHALSGDTVAEAVLAYGGNARAGGVPGGNVFAVDPAFLSYSPQPIEVAVVVRRNEANDNAGFKLVYESATGLKTAKGGWYTIPDNKQWHVVRWKIADAQFVNYWGYNFALESDGPKFGKYFLQSVTVTKLAK